MRFVPASQKVPPRQLRRQELIAATRAMFDERGLQEAPIDAIAKSVGIARGLIYREFSSKEELYVATVTDYLQELAENLDEAERDAGDDPVVRLERMADAYSGFCLTYPAFLDSSLAIMRKPAQELADSISELIWLRLGQGMAACVDHVARILRAGNDRGVFAVEDPDFTANLLWTQMLGAMHLARIRVGMKRSETGVPELFKVDAEQVVKACVDNALATVRPA